MKIVVRSLSTRYFFQCISGLFRVPNQVEMYVFWSVGGNRIPGENRQEKNKIKTNGKKGKSYFDSCTTDSTQWEGKKEDDHSENKNAACSGIAPVFPASPLSASSSLFVFPS